MQKEARLQLFLILAALFLITLTYYIVPPTITGHAVSEGLISDFNYNTSEIEILNGVIQLKSTAITTNWTTHSQETIPIIAAYYKPKDKLDKVETQDDDKQDVDSNKLALLVFKSDLNNGDLINLYLKDHKTTNVYLCPAYTNCDHSTPDLGSFYFPDETGYYNITIQNLNTPTNIFNLNSDEKIKLDFINSTNTNLLYFWHNPDDKTNKITTKNDDAFDVKPEEIFDVIFSESLQDEDILQFYLKEKKATHIYLCNPSEECTTTNKGQINYPNEENYYNITLQNLNTPTNIIGLNSDEKFKPDFLEALRVTATEHSQTNTTYPLTATLTTQDHNPSNLDKWGMVITEATLNNQNITYEFSTDSGTTWTSLPEDKNLSHVNATTLSLKAILNGNGTATPQLSLMNLTYITKEPLEDNKITIINKTYHRTNSTKPLRITLGRDKNLTINSSLIRSELTLLPSDDLEDIEVNITIAKQNRTSTKSRVKELDIDAPDLNDKLYNATLKTFYTDSEIVGLDESTLKFYYYNETSEAWEETNSLVNVEENYIEAILKHFSTYGIFGDAESETNSPSSGGSSSGGSSSSSNTFTRPSRDEPEPVVIKQEPETTITQTETPEEFAPTGNIIKESSSYNSSLFLLSLIPIATLVYFIIRKKKS